MTCTPGAWTGSPAFAFAWLRNGAAIAGASAAGYVVTAGDAGQELRCEVTARNDTGPGVARSAPVVPVPAPAVPGGPPGAVDPPRAKVRITCRRGAKPRGTRRQRAKVKITCKVRPAGSGRLKLTTRKGRQVAAARLKKGQAVLRVRPGRYRVALVRGGRVVKRVQLRVR